MEFVDNTGHIFSLPSYKEKPIGYEYEEYSYVFWIDSNNTTKLSVNNFYSKPIYALYELNKDFDIEDLEDDYNKILDIEIYIDNSNVYKLISSKELQNLITKEDFNLTDYVNLNLFDNDKEKYNLLKSKLTNEDLYCIKTTEIKSIENEAGSVDINYLMIPIYPIAMAKESGTWITNVMIHIHNNSNNTDEWCYISVGGEFIAEYEELIINGHNMGISLPKDILKAIYSESLYNKEYNEALFNEKMKEYLFNYMGIRGEIGNFDSAIKSLKWFGYGDKISISKLLRTDNEFKQQYILDYFNISNDLLESFKTFKSDAFVSLMIYINKEMDEEYPFEFNKDFYGENKPKLLSLIDNYEKIKVGNNDMPIENDDEKYWYWKPYFNFSFNELGIKLICLSYYYKKYFLPIHLNIHSTSLGYKVFTNDIKLTNSIALSKNEPSIMLNNKSEVIFLGNGIHYFTKQIHYIDDQFNEFNLGNTNIETDNREWYYLDDTCVNIPIVFTNSKSNYYNCVLLLQKGYNNETIYESHFSFCQNDSYEYKNFIIYPKKLNITIKEHDIESNYFQYWIDNEFCIKLLVNNKWYEYDFKMKINNPTIDFGTLKYRYYLNDHNYLFGKIADNENSFIHNIIFCGEEDIYKMNNINLLSNLSNLIYDIHESLVLNNMPNDYNNIIINSLYKNKSLIINWNNKTDKPCYVIRKINIMNYNYNMDISSAEQFNEQLMYINIDDLIYNDETQEACILIYPNEWGTPIFIENDLKEINNLIYQAYDINGKYSYIETFDLLDKEYIYQFFKQNYNLLSPFKQINKIDNDNKEILFNSYMHNKQLVNVNDINFDINLHTILKYHLEHNLMHIDGTLINGEFYQYIIITDIYDKKHKIYIHSDLIGKSISIPSNDVMNNDNILVCAYEGEIYILREDYNSSQNSNYTIINVYDEDDEVLFENEEGTLFENNDGTYVDDGINFFLYSNNQLNYNASTNEYYLPNPQDPENPDIALATYPIYDNMFMNTDVINSKYSSIVNLPNNVKYKNSLHLFDIYTKEYMYQNILIFHNNINMYIDGLRFIHGTTRLLNNDDDLKFYLDGEIHTNIDTRYPDTYGLNWSSSIDDPNKPHIPINVSQDFYKYGFYVKRDYISYYNGEYQHIWEVPNLFEYDTNEFTYFKETDFTDIGSLYYTTLEDFYNNRFYKKELNEQYENINIYINRDSASNIFYCFDDNEINYIENLSVPYTNQLSYQISFYDEFGDKIQVSLNDIENITYSSIKVDFSYQKMHIVRNRFYLVIDYIYELQQKYYNLQYEIKNIDDNYFLQLYINGSLIKNEDNPYGIELISFKDKYIYKDQDFDNIISTQNPSMYWYNADSDSLQLLSSSLNEVERYIYNENDSEETIKNNLDNYIRMHNLNNRYADDNDIVRYDYKNYLCKELKNLNGIYNVELITNIDNRDNVRLCVEVIENDGTVKLYNTGNVINFNGDERRVLVYLQINNLQNIRFNYNKNTPEKNYYIIPKINKKIEKQNRLKYNAKETSNKVLKAKYFNQEFEFGDNSNKVLYDLYNDFFKLQFNVYDITIENKTIKPQLLSSVYDCIDKLKLNSYLNYDFYLMHDYEYWYGLYISQETCDKIRNNDDLKILEEDKVKEFNGNLNDTYVLKYNRSSEEYLLNRLEFNTSEGYNQFNNDDIICCYVHNNDRLPFNGNISSKWKIEPMSLGMSLGTQFDSNGEMTILSLPKNNSKHESGYYNVSVKYSLDRDIQHQFKYTTKIKIN